ncbi:MAG: SPASM domain-containing protein, partial [Desulfobacterales bacterium]|nr:SPASM domain-containing protein [Desulfobacterales bacterium]
ALTIMHDGTIYPCRRLPTPIGNALTDSFFKVWYTSEVLWNVRNHNNIKGKCADCELIPVCRGCRAMAYALTGDYLAEDPQCWK